MKIRLQYLLLLFLAVAAGSCIKEDTENCFSGLKLRFRFSLHTETDKGNLFGEKVRYINTYIYDDKGILQKIVNECGPILTNIYVMKIDLKPGKYTAVVWGAGSENLFTSYKHYQAGMSGGVSVLQDLVVGQSSLNDFRMILNCKDMTGQPGSVIPEQDDFDDLFFGAVGNRSTDGKNQYTIVPFEAHSGGYTEHEVEMTRNTNVIKLTVDGLEKLKSNRAALGNKIWIEAANSMYNADNTVNHTAPRIYYIPQVQQTEENALKADIKIQRMEWLQQDENKTILHIVNPADENTLLSVNLIELLKNVKDGNRNFIYKNQEDLDRIYEHPIRVSLQPDFTIKIYVHNWLVQQVKPEM